MPKSTWTVSGSPVSLTPVTTKIDAGSNPNNVNYLTNADKIALINQYAAEEAMKSALDAQANALGVSTSAYDNAVAAINTTLVNAGAPSNWATTWPDGTTFGPVLGIQTLLKGAWSTVASNRSSLQTAISGEQSAQAQAAATSAAATDALNKMNAAILQSQPHQVSWSYFSKPALPSSSYPAGYYAITTDARTVQVNSAGTAWQDVLVAATGIFGKIAANQIVVTNTGGAINADPGFTDPTAWQQVSGTAVTFSAGPTLTSGAVGDAFVYSSSGTDNCLQSATAYPIDPAKVYKLSAALFAASGNDRNMYIYVEFYDVSGNYLSSSITGWGGNKSGYVFGALTPANVFTRQGGQFGPGTGRAIPSNAATCKIGVWFQFGAGTSQVEQAAQDLRLETVVDASLIVDGTITAAKFVAGAAVIDVESVGTLKAQVIQFPDGTRLTSVQPAENGANITAGHVLTSAVIPTGRADVSAGSAAGWVPIPGFGWTVSTQSNADVYNVQARVGVTCNQASVTDTVCLAVDGNTSSPVATFGYFVSSIGAQTGTLTFFASTTGLSAGSHTFQFYAKASAAVSAGNSVGGLASYGILQRIF